MKLKNNAKLTIYFVLPNIIFYLYLLCVFFK
jgi:hypothetical protein